MNFSDFAFTSLASFVRWRILETALSENSFVVSILMTPSVLMNPARTSSPAAILRGTLSPVSADVSANDSPEMILPSRAIRSPGRTSIVSPTAIVSGLTVCSVPFLIARAVSGRMSISDEIDARDLSTA